MPWPPKKNTEFETYSSLISQANTKELQVNPTLEIGDVKVSIDGGTLNNITTLPVVSPAGSTGVKINLSAAEMNGNNIKVIFRDVAGAEWADLSLTIPTAVAQIDDISRLLGLSYENTYQHTRSYTGGKLVSAKMDLYDSKANATTHNGSTGIVAKYTLTFTYSGDELDTMLVVRDS